MQIEFFVVLDKFLNIVEGISLLLLWFPFEPHLLTWPDMNN